MVHYNQVMFARGNIEFAGRDMPGFGRILAVLACLGLSAPMAAAQFLFWDDAPVEVIDAPASGVFVTLERTSRGTLKYAGSKADGVFLIRSLAEGKYRMSITPPKRDRYPEFDKTIKAVFDGIRVIPDGVKVIKREDPADKAQARKGSVIRIPPSVWRQPAIWLEVEITKEDVSGRFEYIIEPDRAEVTVED